MTEFKPENKSVDGLRNIQWNIHNENTGIMYEIYSKFTIKRHQNDANDFVCQCRLCRRSVLLL